MKQKNFIRKIRTTVQRGVTLVELTIVLIIIGIIIAVLYTQIGGSDTDGLRTSNMYRHMKLFVIAADGQQETLGCYSISTGGLITSDDGTNGYIADAANNSCAATTVASLAGTYNGPYIKGIDYDNANDKVVLEDIVGGARGEITNTANTDGATSNVWYQIKDIPNATATAIYKLCIGGGDVVVDPANTATVGTPCILPNVSGSDGVGLLIGNYTL